MHRLNTNQITIYLKNNLLRIGLKKTFYLGSAFFLLIFLVVFFSVNGQFKPTLTSGIIARKIFISCLNQANKEKCYANQFKILTIETNITYAKQTLISLQKIDPQNSNGCHLIAHYISIAETNKKPNGWLDLLRQQDAYICSGGFIHGILEAHMAIEPNFKLDAGLISKICNQIKDQERGRLSCNHNLGHLLLVQEDNNLNKAITICEKIMDYSEKYECLSGIFMENITRLNLEAHGLAKTIRWNSDNTADVENLCRSLSELPAQACWKVISYMYASIYNNDPDKVFEACNKTPTKKTADECYIYGAGNMVVFTNFNPNNLSRVCSVYQSTDPRYKRCIFQIIGSMLSSSLQFSDRVIDQCLNVPLGFRDECFLRIRTILKKTASFQDQEMVCIKIPLEYQNICKIQM